MAKATRKRSRAKTPPDPRKHRDFMRSYSTDADGNRVLIGLTLAETVEYEDYRDASGLVSAARFEELQAKHQAARKQQGR